MDFFIIADLPIPIIRADLLKHLGLLVDVKNQKLLDSTTKLCVKGFTSHTPSFSPMFVKSDHMASYHALLQQHPEITRPTSSEVAVKHSTAQHIDTRGPPVVARPRRLAQNIMQLLKRCLTKCLGLGII